jgi:hypothetical protein
MSETDSTSNQSPRFSTEFFHRISSVITFRRVGLSVAGTFAFVGAAAALNTTGHVDNLGSQVNQHTTSTTAASENSASSSDQSSSSSASSSQNTAGQDGQSSGASTSTSFSSTTTNGQTSTQFTVNGKNIPVPANGSTQQTIVNADGSHTTISSSNVNATQNSATNQSSSNITLNVTTNSSSESGNPSP